MLLGKLKRYPFLLVLIFSIFMLFTPFFWQGKTIVSNYSGAFLPHGPGVLNDKELPFDKVGTLAADDTGSFAGDFAYAEFVKDALLDFDIPWWNPYNFFGEPFAEAATGVFYPPNWVRLLLPSAWFDISNFINYFLLIVFTFFLAREFGLRPEYALLSAMTLLGAAHPIIYTPTNSIGSTFAWFPLMLLGITRISKANSGKAGVGIVAVATYGLLNGFHPGPALSSLLSGLMFFAVLVAFNPKSFLRSSLLCLFGFGLGLSLSAFQVLPFVNLLLGGAGSPSMKLYDNYFDLKLLSNALFPYFLGPLNTVTVLPLHRGQYLFFPVVSILFCVIAGLRWLVHRRVLGFSPYVVALTFITLFTFLWALGIEPFTVFHGFPLLERLNMCYLIGVPVVTLSLLTGFALQSLLEKRVRFLPGLVYSAVAVISIFGVFMAPVLMELGEGLLVHPWWLSTGWVSAKAIGLLVGTAIVAYLFLDKPSVVAFLFFEFLLFSLFANLKVSVESIQYSLEFAVKSIVPVFCLFVISHFFLKTRRLPWVLGGLSLVVYLLYFVGGSDAQLGLPSRIPTYELPPFAKEIVKRNENGLYRAYGMSTFMMPNSSMTAQIPSVNILAVIVSDGARRYFKKFMDVDQSVIQMYGGLDDSTSHLWFSPSGQFFENKKFWSYVGSRFVVTPKLEFNQIGVIPSYLRADLRIDDSSLKPLSPEEEYPLVDILCADYERELEGLSFVPKRLSPNKVNAIKVEVFSGDLKRQIQQFQVGHKLLASDAPRFLVFEEPICKASQLVRKYKVKLSVVPSGFSENVSFRFQDDIPKIVPFERRVSSSLNEFKRKEEFKNLWFFVDDITVPISCPDKKVDTIGFYLSTFGKTYVDKFRLQFKDLDGRVISEVENLNRSLFDNSYIKFPLNEVCSQRKLMYATLSLPEGVSGPHVLWGSDDGNLNHYFKALREPEDRLEQIFHNPDTDSTVWENKDAQPRVYLTNKFYLANSDESAMDEFAKQDNLRAAVFLNKDAELPESCLKAVTNSASTEGFFGDLKGFHESPDTQTIDIEARAPSILTVVDTMSKGWQAELNGQPVPMFKVNGNFRGVCIEKAGFHKLELKYFPPTLYASFALFLFGLITLGVLIRWP